MIKISQFGEGNFLRTFVDVYFNTLNEEGGDYGVYIVKPSSFGSLECLERQNNKYHIVLRGVKDGKATSNFYYIAPTSFVRTADLLRWGFGTKAKRAIVRW